MKTNHRRFIASLLIVSQLSLSSQPKIHAVHHRPATVFVDRETIAAAVLPDTPSDPSASENARLQRERPEDPAPHVKSRLASALQANLNLTNVHTVSDPLESDDIKTLKDVFKTGVVLDVRTMKWGRDNSRGSYSVRARMVRLEDSTVLWKTTCSARWLNDGKPLGAQLRSASDDCAAQLSAKARGRDGKPVSVTGHTIPAEGLPSVPRIVADEHSIELPGLEMTPEERAQFEEQRSARIDSRNKMSFGIGGADPRVIVVCAFFLPVCVAVVAVTIGVVWGIHRTVASAREPSLIPERDSARLAAMLKEQATGASLAERISRLPESPSVPAATEVTPPRLVVRMKIAQPDYSRKRTGVYIVAQAQAFPSTGAEWEPTEHRYEFPSLAWTSNDAELVRREIDGALDALAESISWAYLSIPPTGVSAEEARKSPPMVKDDRQEPGKER